MTEKEIHPYANPDAAQYLAAIVASSDDAIISKSLQSIIQTWNHGAERIFGYTAEEAIGKSIMMLIPSDRQDEENHILSKIRAGERIENYETIRVTKNGRKINVSLSVSPVKDKGGNIIGVSKIARDITMQKKAEEALIRSNRELEQFAYVASHDLQEPLRKVALYSEMLEMQWQDKLDEQSRKYLGNIVTSVNRMKALIEDLLSYSRANKEVIDKEELSLDNTLQQVLRDQEVLIKERDAKVIWETLPTVYANRFQMHQLLQNLIGNALKFTKTKPVIHVSSQSANGQVTVSVQDNGIGIDPRYHEQIFKVFQRLHRREEYPGTGIGLAVCKKIVESHNGKIWISSVLGKGSTFYFSLPAGRKAENEEPPAVKAVTA